AAITSSLVTQFSFVNSIFHQTNLKAPTIINACKYSSHVQLNHSQNQSSTNCDVVVSSHASAAIVQLIFNI
ncbi:MAG: hypothetical protein U9Q66_02890, partial [Patescibacteria group bacterium]|nr:hypothetical protein [Patescibacteria group bacterium]